MRWIIVAAFLSIISTGCGEEWVPASMEWVLMRIGECECLDDAGVLVAHFRVRDGWAKYFDEDDDETNGCAVISAVSMVCEGVTYAWDAQGGGGTGACDDDVTDGMLDDADSVRIYSSTPIIVSDGSVPDEADAVFDLALWIRSETEGDSGGSVHFKNGRRCDMEQCTWTCSRKR